MTKDELEKALVALCRDVKSLKNENLGDYIARADSLGEEAIKAGELVSAAKIWHLASCAALLRRDTQLAISYAERMMRDNPCEVYEQHLEICRDSDAHRRKT